MLVSRFQKWSLVPELSIVKQTEAKKLNWRGINLMPISIKKLLLSLSNQWKSRRSIDSFLQIATRALLVTALFNSQFVSFLILVTVQGFQKHAKSFSLTLFVLANYHLDFTVSNIYQRPHSTNFQVVFTLKTTFSYSQLSCMAPRTESVFMLC